MAGIIHIAEDQQWAVSNWVYWGLMDQVLEIVAEEAALADFVEQCKWMQHLDIPSMMKDDTTIAVAVLAALRTAAQKCSEGATTCKVNGRILDDESQRQFREATGELVAMLLGLPNATSSD